MTVSTEHSVSSNLMPIAIGGAGPVGLACALMLVKAGVPAAAIHLFDAKTTAQTEADQRTIALSYGSQQILASLGAWPIAATAIHDIHVSKRGHFGRTLIRQTDYDLPALGYVAAYADILRSLHLCAEAAQLQIHRPVSLNDASETDDGMILHSADQNYRCQFFIQAEGGVFQQQAQRQQHRDYQQTALIFNLQTDQPQQGRAFERFCQHGPLALLPLHQGYAVVWCVSPPRADTLKSLSEAEFIAQLQTEFGYRAGRFLSVSARLAFPLGLNAQSSASAHAVSIGNAAQTLHPVAGQGLNLGLRDAAELATLLSQHYHRQGSNWYCDKDFSQRYLTQRHTDRRLTIGLTDTLAQSFAQAAGQSLLSLGLATLDNVAPLRHSLASHMLFGWRS